MHRSGTSMLTHALSEAGLFVGRPEDLMPVAASNPHGHGEILRMARLNDAILAASGAHWAGPVEIDYDRFEEIAKGRLGDVARRMLSAELDGVELVKDPRFCLTLPFWRRVLDDRIVLVVPWRHPTEVGRSLAARNRLPEAHGRLLWATYYRRLATAAVGLPRLVVAHRDLVTDPANTIASVWRFLGESAGLSPRREIEQPVQPDLVHHIADEELDASDREVLAALTEDRIPPPLSPEERQNRALLFGVAAALGNEHDRLRALLTGQNDLVLEADS